MTDATKKDHLGLVIIGHVDAGKSTTTGHLLFKLGGISKRDMEKLQAEADAQGKGSFAYAFYMDKQKEERERGVTIVCSTKEFFTDKFHYTIIDAPGHRDFIKNMISGASQADVALLMVPAKKGGFETSIQKGDHKRGVVQGQTRQHAFLAKLLGIDQLIVAVNKMDDPSVKYSEDRFNEIKDEVSKMITKAGYKPKRVPFIPISGYLGENLIDKSDKMPWYKGFSVPVSKGVKKSGHTLLDALNDVVKCPKRPVDAPVRVPLSGVFKIRGVGDVLTGRVEQGSLTPGTTVGFCPSGTTGKVFTIEMHHKSVPMAGPGDNVGLNIKGLDKDDMPRAGDVMYVVDDPKDTAAPRPIKSFRALVFIQDHPGQLRASRPGGAKGKGIGGFTPSVHVRTSKAPCCMTKIHWKLGKKSTNNTKMDDPPFVQAGDQAEVTFEPKLPFYVEEFSRSKGLGRLAVMDSNSLIMLGRVKSVEYVEE